MDKEIFCMGCRAPYNLTCTLRDFLVCPTCLLQEREPRLVTHTPRLNDDAAKILELQINQRENSIGTLPRCLDCSVYSNYSKCPTYKVGVGGYE